MKIKKCTLALLSFLMLCSLVKAQKKKQESHPKLVVGIIVDQMRWDYLYRLYDRYGDNGFKRLLNEGFSFENCMVNYIPSFTAIGHSTVYTGSVPSIHGIAGNDFTEQATGRNIYCTEDPKVKTVGIDDPENKVGKMSPYNLKVTTVTDQLKYATNFRSKVIGVSLKDRGSILPAGHAADAAYWFDAKSGNWISSTYYMQSLPAWLSQYNAKKMPEKYLSRDWNPEYPISTYIQSPDIKLLGRYETGFKNYETPSFPMKTSEMIKTLGVGLIQYTPYGNTTTTDIAKLAIDNEKLGNNSSGDTDFLAVSYSSPDKMAHHYSINSILTEDSYIKLDKEIADLLNHLDSKIGKGNYLVFLSADHAGNPNAKFLNDHKMPADVWVFSPYAKKLNDHLKSKFGKDNLVRSFMNYQVNLNYDAIKESGLNIEELKQSCIDYLQTMDGVLYAVDMKKASQATVPHYIKEKIINGYNKDLSGEIQIILKAGWYDWDYPDPTKGGTHGTWGPDDAHIPFILMGWRIPHGRTTEEVYMTDIAPTISALLKIQMPSGAIGKPVDYKMK
ncbi:alkaline phosphatase family protein [Apibacter raozihei]|uniref:alkaline phosphatase PafA n=1 Tax=Apibacter raozihei TaxID=2500547 RepID=UPI000FE3B2CC|nr:alkaline phosphatase PafA [Apibacter raozihei]